MKPKTIFLATSIMLGCLICHQVSAQESSSFDKSCQSQDEYFIKSLRTLGFDQRYFGESKCSEIKKILLNVTEPSLAQRITAECIYPIDLEPYTWYENTEMLIIDCRVISDLRPLKKFRFLTRLSLRQNQIKDITQLAFLTNLKSLTLNGQSISDLRPLSSLQQLKILRLSANQIKDPSPLSSLTNLQELVLSSNQISNLEPISKLKNLKNLYLADNSITDIKPLSNLTSLIGVRLGNNKIKDLSSLPKNIEYIELEGNPIDISTCPAHLLPACERAIKKTKVGK